MILIGFSLASCVKTLTKLPEDNTYYTIEGHLFYDCDKEPVKGLTLRLIQNTVRNLFSNEDGLLDTCVTDSNGYYKFVFKDKGGTELLMRYKAGWGYNTLIQDIPDQICFLDLNLYKQPSINLEVSLNVINPYSEKDTLVVNDFKSIDGFKTTGPFKSGLLFRSENVGLLESSWAKDFYYVSWFLLPYGQRINYENFSVDQYCDNTIRLTLNIE